MSHRTLAVVLAGFSAFLTLFMTQPLLPEFMSVFRASRVAVSLTVTAATLGVAIAAPLIGSVADRLGRKKVIVTSAYLLAASTLLGATAGSLPALIAWRFVEGLFTPGVFAITVAYIQEEWASGGAGTATAAYVTGTVLGGFFSRLLSGLIAARFSWQLSFVTIGILGMAAAAALSVWLPHETRFQARAENHSMMSAGIEHLRNRRLLATFMTGFCVLFSLLGVFTYITFHLAAPPFRLGSGALGFLFFVYLAGVVITPNSGRLIDHYGQRITIAVAMTAARSGVLLTLSPSLWVVVVGLAMTCSGVFVANSCANSYIGIAAGHNKALAVGLYVTFYYLGGTAGSSFPGYVWNFGGWPACVALFFAVQISTVFVALVWWDKHPPVSPPLNIPVLRD